jgi:succinyl-CoA synthetase beta subunit
MRAQPRGRTCGRWLEEHAVKDRLRGAVEIVPGRLADDAVAAWRELGGPVAVKRTGVLHKARAGGLALNLDTEAGIRAAQERLGTPVLVERMAPPGAEWLVAIKRDGFVPVLVVGRGGVDVEAHDDVAILPLPVRPERLPPAVADIALGLAATDFVLVELNPVIVHAHGAVAVDALADEEVLR